MPAKVIMPKLGLTMQEGTIIKWFKSEGDPVHKGEQLYEFETDKAVMQVEARTDGVVGKILAGEGATVPIGGTVAWIVAPGEEIPGETPEKVSVSKASVSAVTASAAEIGGRQRVDRVKVSPVARQLGKEVGLDLTTVQGTGPEGGITKKDVEQALAQMREAAAISEIAVEGPAASVPLTGLRAVIARHMAASAHTTAPVTLISEVDAGQLVATRERVRAEIQGVSYDDLFILIVARALRKFRFMNARLQGELIEQLAAINVGLAVHAERELLVPVIRNADRKTLRQITLERQELVGRARAGKPMPDDLAGATFTITNLGIYGADAFIPLINLPETAILGVGRIKARPSAGEGRLRIQETVRLSLTFDHRLVDSAPAARFLQHIRQLTEQPYLCLLW